MQTATKRKISEAEMRRAEFKVYENQPESKRQRLQKKRYKQRVKQGAQVLASVFCIFMMCMGYMLLSSQITMLGYEINQTLAAIDSLSNDNAKLILEIESATSPEKVNDYAMNNFNMVAATEDKVVYYDANGQLPDNQLANNGMAVDASVLGYGSVEILEEEQHNNIIDTIASLWQSLTSGGSVQVGMRN